MTLMTSIQISTVRPSRSEVARVVLEALRWDFERPYVFHSDDQTHRYQYAFDGQNLLPVSDPEPVEFAPIRPGDLIGRPGQGSPAMVWIGSVDSETVDTDEDEDDPWSDARRLGAVTVDIDTGYAYSAANGAGCRALHSWVIHRVHEHFSAQGGQVHWQDESTGAVYQGVEMLAEVMGNPLTGDPNSSTWTNEVDPNFAFLHTAVAPALEERGFQF